MFARGMAGKLQDARDARNEEAQRKRRAGSAGGWVSAAGSRLSGADRDQTRAPRGAGGDS
jgi:hypothetical protein